MSNNESKRDSTRPEGFPKSDVSGMSEQTKMVLQDSLCAFRKIKRTHRSLFEAEPGTFRQLLRKAEGQVFNRKRGPKPDPGIASAAREVANGTTIEEAFLRRYPSDFITKNQTLYAMALESFRAKVNAHIRRRPVLKRLRKAHAHGKN